MRYIRVTMYTHSTLFLNRMPAKKTTTLNLRIDPKLKEALRIAASLEHRSNANMVEVLIIKHCEMAGIAIPEQEEMFKDDD
jgi:hypothetical protein